MISGGGVFLDWSEKIKKSALSRTPQHLNAFQTISNKGFWVFENGCILPHPYYSKKGKEGPARFRGSKAAFQLFHVPVEAPVPRNEDFWPMTTEITHLCHWSACMNPDHLVSEPRWKNWKRLYCFGCDCNVEPKCLSKFRPSAFWQEEENWPGKLGYADPVALKRVLPDDVRILPKTTFRKKDLVSKNRIIRKKRAKKHSAQRRRKKKS